MQQQSSLQNVTLHSEVFVEIVHLTFCVDNENKERCSYPKYACSFSMTEIFGHYRKYEPTSN